MEKELLIDAIYINNSGGKILLDYLIQELEKSKKKVFYLLDKRVETAVPFLDAKAPNVLFLSASLINRHKFYLQNKHRFTSVLCFGDLPPSIRLNAEVYTYFHQQLYIKFPNDIPLTHKVLFTLKRTVLKYLFDYSDYWMLQTSTIKDNFQKKFKTSDEKLLLMPFYPPMTKVDNAVKKKYTYVYVSNAPPHKNHIRLINAFCAFYDKHGKGELILTIDENFPHLLALINEKIVLNYPINNIGFIERDKLNEVYQSAEYLIFPSLAESFGLGIVEAIEHDCKVIGADLPYLHAACEPSLIFNPFDELSITDALSQSLKENVKSSICHVRNRINDLISVL